MKFYNVSAQSKTFLNKAWTKEYINLLTNQVNSLYEYLHYYNPEWRIISSNSSIGLSYYTYDNNKVDSSILIQSPKLYIDITKLKYRWGYKNTSQENIFYGVDDQHIANAIKSINVGATIFKKDAYDTSYNDADLLSHFIVYESSLAQYITWTVSTAVGTTAETAGQPVLKYVTHLSDELDLGLAYDVQIMRKPPRYFYLSNNLYYPIRYTDNTFDSEALYDYSNYNVRYRVIQSSGEVSNYIPQYSPGQKVYQLWDGGIGIVTQVVYTRTDTQTNKDKNEDLIGDTILYESARDVKFQVRLDKNSSNASEIESHFEVIFN